MNQAALGESKLQRVISIALRTGVTVASVIGIVGGMLFLARHGAQPVSFRLFDGTNSPYASVTAVGKALNSGDHSTRDLAIAQLGIVVLLLTPIIRVALSIVGFLMERDRAYVVITSVVLVTLMASVFLR
jgi:uncharacterized membrane protein